MYGTPRVKNNTLHSSSSTDREEYAPLALCAA